MSCNEWYVLIAETTRSLSAIVRIRRSMFSLHYTILKRLKPLSLIKINDNYSSNWSSRSREDYNRHACCRELKERGVKVGGIVSGKIRINNISGDSKGAFD